MSVIEHRFESREDLVAELFQVFTQDLGRILENEPAATLLLSGGSTPAPLYRKLSSADLDWARVSVALVDERWVDPASEASNERLLRETLLVGRAAKARFTGMKNDHPTPFDGVAQCNARYARLPSPYSICLLGMGPDGHTASLFPRAEGLESALESSRHCAAIRALRSDVTGDNIERMTMTPWSILQSRRLILLITGEDKWSVLQQAREAGVTADLPVSCFIHQDRAPLEVYWAP